MSEIQTIKHLNIGYDWNYSLEVEKVVPVEGTRASAKTTEKFSFGGNTETYEEAKGQLVKAMGEIKGIEKQ
jgi:hypothetical protein